MNWIKEDIKVRNRITGRIGILKRVCKDDILWEIQFDDGSCQLSYSDQIEHHYEPLTPPSKPPSMKSLFQLR